MDIIMWVVLGIVVLAVIYIIALYNGLIRLKNRVDEAWSDIDVQLKRRYDLIPNLIETVKGYAAHEQATFEKVIAARSQAMVSGAGAEQKAAAENMLTDTLKSLFALSENYPDLKANQNFLKLQDELSDTENKIQASRRFYNSNIRDFNTKLQTFPTNVFGSILKFTVYKFFEAAATERENVKVAF